MNEINPNFNKLFQRLIVKIGVIEELTYLQMKKKLCHY